MRRTTMMGAPDEASAAIARASRTSAITARRLREVARREAAIVRGTLTLT